MEGEMKGLYASKKQELEMAYGVHIAEDALAFAAQVLQAYGNESTLPKDTDAMQLVERACQSLRRSLDSDCEETNLDWDEYCLDRAFVEVMELRKEKTVACRSVFLPHVQKELVELTSKWECFEKKWVPVVEQLRHGSEKRVVLLRRLRHQMVSFMKRTKLQGYAEVEYLVQLLPLLSTATTQLQHTIHSAFKERLYVGPCAVAEVASSMTGLPSKYFRLPFKLRPTLEDLKSKLSEKLIGLDDVIHKITCALSKQKSSTGPFGSFLLLGSHGSGRTKLAKSLAEEIFGDKERFMKLDMSEYKEPDYVSRLLVDLSRDKKRGSIVMFDNIENANGCCSEVLSQILKDGRLTDGRGMCVNFSHDLVLISSYIGHEVFCHCNCLGVTIPKLPFHEILEEPALLHQGMSYNICHLRPFYAKVADQFELEFMDLFDDVVVFSWLTPQNHMAISRLQLRDVATSMSTLLKKQVILYPSDAAVQNIISHGDFFERGTHAYETWHKVYLDHLLYDDVVKNEADDRIIIYIDALVGLRNEYYSFRVEKSRHLEKYLFLKSFKEKMWKLRTRYRREKLQVNKIYRLQTIHFHLFELMRAKAEVDTARVLLDSEEVVRLIDDLLMNEPSDSSELELVQVGDFNGELGCCPGDRKWKRAKICLKHVSKRLKSSLQQRDRATQTIIQALLKRLNTFYDDQSNESCHLPTSFLCLGLTPFSKEQFAKSLGEHLVVDDGKKLLIQVDLSLCTEPESFFRCAYTVDTHLLLTEAVKRSPHSVIVFYQLEMAHISVFSTILSILDDGVSKDNDGNIINFGNSVVVIVSDLGNQEMIARLNGRHSVIKWRIDPIEMESTSKGEGVVGSSLTDKMGFRGLRSELLNRLDQLLLFDPFSGDQLNRFAKLPMKSLEEKTGCTLNAVFFNLFNVQGQKRQSFTLDALVWYLKEARAKAVEER
ncbi:hypothetical protein Pfo_000723 [Paulownia fortunei]|nr:hypothetical protein Pfo_000723 [Paulownia fortunei]